MKYQRITKGPNVTIKVFSNEKYIRSVRRCLRPGGSDRRWYVLYKHKLIEVFGDSMDNLPDYTTVRYIVVE